MSSFIGTLIGGQAAQQSYLVPEAAQALGLHEETVRRWIREGRLAAERVPGRGRGSYRIPGYEVDRLRGGPTPAPLEQRALGKYLFRKGDLRGARGCYEASLRASGELRDPLGEAKSLYKLGQISRGEELFPEAESCLLRAEALYEEVSCRKGEDATRLALADLALARPRSESRPEELRVAKDRYTEALASGDDRDQAIAERGLGEIALEEGDLDEAGARLAESFDRAAMLGDPLMQADALRSLGRYFAKRGRPHEALLRLESAARTYADYGLEARVARLRDEIERLRLQSTGTGSKPVRKRKKRSRAIG